MKVKIILLLLIVNVISESKSQHPDCGTHKTLRSVIIGGNSTVRGEHPWKAALINTHGQFFCGGSLVSKKAVLTAAHCIKGKGGFHDIQPDEISVVLGALDLSNTYEKGRVVVGVESIQVHPDWNIDIESYEGDIALLTLETEIQFSPTIQRICLSRPNTEMAQATEGIVIGYGKTEDGKSSNIAKKLIVPIKSYHQCVKEHDRLKVFLSARTFCGGPGDGRGICDGDSGSGLYVLHDNRFYLRGTASASTLDSLNSCNVNTFAVFVDTTDYCGWIQSGGTNKYARCKIPRPPTTPATETEKPVKATPATETKKPVQVTPATETEKPAIVTEKPIKDTLISGECLNANEFIQSKNKCFKVYYQVDGNFVNYRASTMQHTWQAQTHGTCTKFACMQGDGNFVVYDCHGVARWNTHTHGNPGARIVIQGDGNLVVYSPNNVALWNSRTVTHC
ncbi:CLIP domain-containing serine protease B4-like [Chironomus tepperi]|uniref:CLIP domain-containing serine protease B4-like n=1 Tax=Chironomus tepperi TaxID=113505 RepID=UPI00391F885B